MAAFGIPGGTGPNQATEFALPFGPFADGQQAFQPNQAEHTSRTHELDLFSSTAVSSLLHAVAIAAAVGVSVPHVSRAEAAAVEAYPSTLLRAQVPIPAVGLVQPKVLIGEARAVDRTESFLLTHQAPFPVGINPKVLVGEARAVDAYPPSFLVKSQVPTVIGTNQPKFLRGDAADVSAALGNLLKASTPSAQTVVQPRRSVVDPQRPDEPDAFSWSQYIIYFDAPILKPMVGDSVPLPFNPPSALSKITQPVSAAAAFQPNQAEHQQGIHELNLIESQNRSGLLKAHFEAQASTVSVPLKPLIAEAEQFQAKPSTLTQPRFEPVLQRVRFANVDPTVPDAYPSTLAKPRFETVLQAQSGKFLETDPTVPAVFDSSLARPRFEPVLTLVMRPEQTEPGSVAAFDSTLSRPRFEPALTQQNLRILVGEAERSVESASTIGALNKPRFEAQSVQQNLKILVTEPTGATADWITTNSRISTPRFEPPPVIQGINPHVIVAGPQDNFDGMFTSGSTLTIPNHTEPFVPPVVPFTGGGGKLWPPMAMERAERRRDEQVKKEYGDPKKQNAAKSGEKKHDEEDDDLITLLLLSGFFDI